MNQTNWISVESRLPDDGDSVLIVYGPHRDISLATYYSGEHKWLDAIREAESYSPDFWMPLPKAPPKPDPFEEWWKTLFNREARQAGLNDSNLKVWCEKAWNAALKSKEHA